MSNSKINSETIHAISKVSSTSMNMDNMFDLIKNILAPDFDKLIYITIPMWSYTDNTWQDAVPGYYGNLLYQDIYNDFFSLIKRELQFSFVDFISTKLSTIPLYIDIEYIDEPYNTESQTPKKNHPEYLHLYYWQKNSIVYDVLSITEEDELFQIFTRQIINYVVGANKKTILKLYKFLGIYKLCFKELKYITIVSSILYRPNNSSKDIGYGSAIIVLKDKIPEVTKQLLSIILNIKHKEFAVSDWVHKSTLEIQRESIKSAKAAIMSRNMSHNLGSHVMFYIKQKLQSVSKIVNNNVLHNIIPGNLEDINIKTITDKIAANKDVELPFLVGLGRFINYLQERQDYIATVATNYIPARSTISFKDFIYDELKPDLRYERHKRNDSSSDNGWQPKNLLLDYIAYSEGYSKSDAIEIKFGEFDGHNPLDVTAETDFQALRKFNVAVPGGVIGRQAIFSIVENIIRNAAKHSEHRTDGKLVLQLSLVDAEKDFTGDFLTDKFRCMRKEKCSMESGESLVKLYQNHKDAFHILRIKLDMPNKEEDIEALVGKLGEDYVEEDGSMKETSKGLKEMRISAAWLRGHSIDTAIPTTEPPVLAVYSEPYKDDKDKETISYFLCIPKPCKVAFVVDKELLTYRDDNGKESSYLDLNPMLEPFGCAVFGYDDEAKQLNKKEQNDKEQGKENKYQISDIADYEIVCMLLDGDKKVKINNILPYISSRYITTGETAESILKELQAIVNSLSKDNVAGNDNEESQEEGNKKEDNAKETLYAQIKAAIDSIYEKWFEETHPGVSYKLLVADENAEKNTKKADSILCNDNDVVLTSTGKDKTCDDWVCDNAVVFLTHFKGLNHPDIKKESYYQNILSAACLESITGNNSTDRLIRQDEWTKEWKSKHLSAGLAKIAIFDERIFSSFISRETLLKADKIDINEINKLKVKYQQDDNAKKFSNILQEEYGIFEDDASDIFYDIYTIESIIDKYSISYKYDVAQKNYERRIWAFDIRVPKGCSEVDIVGYNAHILNSVGAFVDHHNDAIILIAKIVRDNNGGYAVQSCDNQQVFKEGISNIFDYITIHQGVLDKIYGAFSIKNNNEEKSKITNALHSYFSKYAIPEKKEKENTEITFLPNFIIHSGRSNPSKADMPQKQPFVQFAAIDHAVKDCKYTLVELLATAHYEESSNNY